MEYKEPKFKPQDKVIVEGIETEVVKIMFNDGAWLYQVKSSEVDFEKKEIINGVKTVTEAEIKEVPAKDEE